MTLGVIAPFARLGASTVEGKFPQSVDGTRLVARKRSPLQLVRPWLVNPSTVILIHPKKIRKQPENVGRKFHWIVLRKKRC
jgi:hypothetical protein